MRTGVFVGAMLIAGAINPCMGDDFSEKTIGFISVVLVCAIFMDVWDFLRDKKPN